jgi:hypothetical protein
MKRLIFSLTLPCLLLTVLLLACEGGGGTVESVALRSQPDTLAKAAILESIKTKQLYSPGENISGQLILKNRFEPVILQDGKVVNDHVTNLMWQQDETTRLNWREVEAYLAKTNEENFAGYSDWRIPTVEELASLITPDKEGDYFIDPVFQKELLHTWTSDEVEGQIMGAWFIDFNNGKPGDGNRAAGVGDVRLVRNM